MTLYRHQVKLDVIERADRSPPEIDLAPSEWEEVRDWTGTAAPEDRRVGARRIGSFWILATILLLAIAAGPALAAITHHIG